MCKKKNTKNKKNTWLNASIVFMIILLSIFLFAFSCNDFQLFLKRRFALEKQSDIFVFLGIGLSGSLVIIQQVLSYRRTSKEMD